MEKRKKKISMAGVGCLAACCLLLFCGCGSQASSFVVEDAEGSRTKDAREKDSTPGEGTGDGGSRETEDGVFPGDAPRQIYVQVSGAVAKPGVYQLEEGSRVFMAVELAGGLSSEADESSLNQAQALSDGQQVHVYAVGEREYQETQTEDDGRVNLNTASAQELMSLPGIGQSKADSIIAYRESNGGFGAVEDLMKIEGIKEGVFSKIKDRIKV